jgi:cytochrome c5
VNLSKKTYTSLAFAVLAAAGLITESLAATDTVEQVNARIKPIGQVRINDGSAPTPAAPAGSKTVGRSASEIYKKTCMACHAAGIANAPKIGDQPAWDARMAKGMDTLLGSVNKGMGAMPPKGGDATLTDDEIKATIKFMSEGAKESAVAATPTQTAVVEEKPAPKKKEPAPEKPVGQKIYESTCMACHLMGVAGAPKVGDHAAWAQRATKGIDGLTASVINGLNAMPPRAGNPQLTDVDIQQAVAYMLDKSK